MASLLKGTAFITGAASGIGQGTALAFARHGIKKLALADVNLPALEAANNALRAQFPDTEILSLKVDVANGDDVRAAISETVKRFGRLDVAVNNAGIGGSGRMTHDIDEEEWRRVVNVDLDGVWRCQREELAVMIHQEDLGPREGRGRIINMASMYGTVGPSSLLPHTSYAAAKHGVIGLTRGDANTYGHMNIRVNAICPGFVETPLIAHRQKLLEKDPTAPLAVTINSTPLKRLAMVEEIADAITFLASPMSSFMNGAAMVVDGGFTSN